LSPTAIRTACRLGLWGAATWCILSLHDAPIAREHSICGPWGCGPTIPALLSAHGFWLLVAIPAAFWAATSLTTKRSVEVGLVCLGIGLVGIVAVALGESIKWPGVAHHEGQSYLIQRILFSLATTVQVPLFQTTLAGLILVHTGHRGKKVPRPAALGSGSDGASCVGGLCDPIPPLDEAKKLNRIEIGKPMPRLTLSDHEGRAFVVDPENRGRASVFYFMRAPGCSICLGHLRSIARIFEARRLDGTDVFIVHAGVDGASRALQESFPSAFTIASGRAFGAHEAIGLAGLGLGLGLGSGTVLADKSGVVRLANLAALPFGTFSEPELMNAHASIMVDRGS
jgi:peroxiredoxin